VITSQAAISEVLSGAGHYSRLCCLQSREFTNVWGGDCKAAAGFTTVCHLSLSCIYCLMMNN